MIRLRVITEWLSAVWVCALIFQRGTPVIVMRVCSTTPLVFMCTRVAGSSKLHCILCGNIFSRTGLRIGSSGSPFLRFKSLRSPFEALSHGARWPRIKVVELRSLSEQPTSPRSTYGGPHETHPKFKSLHRRDNHRKMEKNNTRCWNCHHHRKISDTTKVGFTPYRDPDVATAPAARPPRANTLHSTPDSGAKNA